jgi:general secretion pathway protein G
MCILFRVPPVSTAFPTVTGSHMRPRRSGFTLIELLVVMAIIATLLMIAVPRYFRSLEQAREATLRQDLAVMRDAIDKFMGDIGRYPIGFSELVEKRYLRAIPVDPLTKSAETWIPVLNDDPDNAGVRDLHSGAEGASASGVAFNIL